MKWGLDTTLEKVKGHRLARGRCETRNHGSNVIASAAKQARTRGQLMGFMGSLYYAMPKLGRGPACWRSSKIAMIARLSAFEMIAATKAGA